MDIPLPPVPLPLSREALIDRINAALADNNIQGISAEDVRSRMIEIVASSANLMAGEGAGGVPPEPGVGYLQLSGGTLTGPLTLAGDPAGPLEAATRQLVDAKASLNSPAFTGTPTAPTSPVGDSSDRLATNAFVADTVLQFLPLSGGPMSGPLTLAGAPLNPLDAATKQYVDSAVTIAGGLYLPLAGGALTGPLTLFGTPSFPQEAATKAYVDAGLVPKASLASPAFTGVPTAPTATPLTATLQLANTTFVTTMGLLKADLAGATFTGPVNVLDPVGLANPATKGYVDSAIAGVVTTGFLPLAGGTMTGALTLAGNPAAALEATPRQYVDAADLLRAPLASPGLTGVPTAPTAAPGTSTTQLATTAFVAATLAGKANLSGATFTGPVILDADPATALGAATRQYVDAADAAKAPLNSPTFTGVPAGPTATPGTSTTQLATTAFVAAANALQADLAGATFTGAVTATALTVNAGAVTIDRVGDATQAALLLAADAGFAEQILFRTGSANRWLLQKTLTAEAGANAGSNFSLTAYDDAGVSLGNAFDVTRSSRIVNFPVSPTAPTPTAGDATTKLATTQFVATAVAGATAGGVPPGGTANQILSKNSSTNYDMSWKDPSGLGTFLPLTGGTLSGALTLSGNPTVALHAATMGYVDAADALKAPLASPTFTGTPAAPTAGTRIATTQLATTAFVNNFYLPLTGGTLTGALTLSGDPTASLHPASKSYVDTADALKANLASPAFTGTPTAPTAGTRVATTQLATTAFVNNFYLPLSGGTVTGAIVLPGSPANPLEAATKAYVDSLTGGSFLPLAGGTMSGPIVLSGLPTLAAHAASKSYVDTASAGKADLASPAFTGTPTAPTPAARIATGQLATTKFVSDFYLPLTGGVLTGTLTLAADPVGALQPATKQYVDVTDALKAPLVSPAFTGVPTAPTAIPSANNTQLATTAYVTAAANLKANLASPALTGTPTAPTAVPGTNSTQLATTAFVAAADLLKANLTSPAFTGTPTAPTAVAGTSTTQLATTAFVTTADNLKADIASPSLTGVPAAPTAAPGTNTTQLATTAFVAAAAALKASLTGAAFTGPVSVAGSITGTSLTAQSAALDTVGLALNATLRVHVDAGQVAQVSMYTGANARWVLRKDNVAETGANAGSNFSLQAYDDAGVSIGSIFSVTRSSRVMAFSVSPTVPSVIAGDASTKAANTAFVAAAVAAATTGGVPAGGATNQILTKLSATDYDMGWVNPAGIGTFLPLSGGTLTGPLTLSNNPTTSGMAANKAYVDTADALKADLASPALTGTPTGPTAATGTNTTQLATTAFVKVAGDLKAPLTSPSFAGVPLAPTAAAGTNTTQIANTAFVAAALALKANLASPALTGTPTAPTAAAGTSSTQIASTAFVTAADNLKADKISPTFSGTPTAPAAADLDSSNQIANTAWVNGFVEDRLGWVFPEQFSTTNDNTAIQGMFAWLAANGGRGLLTRWYNVTAEIHIDTVAKPFLVEGIGRYICGIKRASTHTNSNIEIHGSNVTLRNFGVDGNKRTYGEHGHGVQVYDSANVLLENLYVYDFFDTGILVTTSDLTAGRNNRVVRCHVNGGSGSTTATPAPGDSVHPYRASLGGANGISLMTQEHSYAEGCYVENIHSQTPCIALQFKGGSNNRYVNCSVYNCLVAMSAQSGGTIGGSEVPHPSNCHFEAITVSNPNTHYYDAESGLTTSAPVGCRLDYGYNVSASGLAIDGNNVANFTGVLIQNDTDGPVSVEVSSIMHCQGAGSFPVKLACRSALVELQNIYDVGDTLVRFEAGARDNTVRFGRKHEADAEKILAPYSHIDDLSGQMSNIVQLIGGPPRKTVRLDDDQVWYVNVDDGSDVGTVEIATNSDQEWFHGWVRTSSSPLVREIAPMGTDIAIGIGTLAAGASGGVDDKLNIYASDGRLTIKNRMGATRYVSIALNMFH